jgi:hypothetical protein
MKIKSPHETLNDILADAKKYPRDWKAIFGEDPERLSRDCYILHPDIGIYLLKEYQKNPFHIEGVGGKIARHIDEDIEEEITKNQGEFGIIQGDIKKITRNIKKGIHPDKILQAVLKGRDLGITMPVRGRASTSKHTFVKLQHSLSDKQKSLNSKFEKVATNDGLYTSYS